MKLTIDGKEMEFKTIEGIDKLLLLLFVGAESEVNQAWEEFTNDPVNMELQKKHSDAESIVDELQIEIEKHLFDF